MKRISQVQTKSIRERSSSMSQNENISFKRTSNLKDRKSSIRPSPFNAIQRNRLLPYRTDSPITTPQTLEVEENLMEIYKEPVKKFMNEMVIKKILLPRANSFLVSQNNICKLILYCCQNKPDFLKYDSFSEISGQFVPKKYESHFKIQRTWEASVLNGLDRIASYLQKLKDLEQLIQKYKLQREMLQVQIKQYERASYERHQEIDIVNQELRTLKYNYSLKVQQITLINNQIQEKTKHLSNLEERKLEIQQYVNEQRNINIKETAILFKQIQAQLSAYAFHLQHNKVATDTACNFNKLSKIEQLLHQEMKEVNRALMQSPKLETDHKNTFLRDYVLKVHEKYKIILQEQQDFIKEKTNMIEKFLQMMRKWYTGWECKQSLLIDLRMEFSLTSIKLDEMFTKKNQNVMQIQILVRKLIQNYMLGNSFY